MDREIHALMDGLKSEKSKALSVDELSECIGRGRVSDEGSTKNIARREGPEVFG